MDDRHKKTVADIQRQIRTHYANKVPFRIYHGSTNSTRVLTYKQSEMVNISDLNKVLSIDEATQVALVEPNVPMDKLVSATLKRGLIPPIVTEFPGITVGGAIQGSAAETSSFKWGCFSQTVQWMEMILGEGKRVEATPNDYADLFYGTAGSCGSLGLVTAAKIKLIPAKQYVTVTHIPVDSFKEALRVSEQYTKTSCDYIECLMFSKDHGSVIIGNLSDDITGKLRRFHRPYDAWYYLYVKEIADLKKEVTDTIPLKDYLFRYDRGTFWAGQMAFDYLHIPFNASTRFLMNPIMKARKMYQALQESAASQRFICQDIVLPTKTALAFLEFLDKELTTYPLAFFPMKPAPRSPLQCNGFDEKLLINLGVYGLRVDPYEKFVEANRRIEAKTRELGGRKWFYAHLYYSEKEFWQIYNKSWYDALRKKHKATGLPDVYQRTSIKEKFPMSPWRALIRTIFGRAKLRVLD